MKQKFYLLAVFIFVSMLNGYSQKWKPIITDPEGSYKSVKTSVTTPVRSDKSSTWQPVITDTDGSKISNTTSISTNYSTTLISNAKNTVSNSGEIVIRKKDITYDPQYNMCITLEVINNNQNKTIVAIRARVHYGSKELKSVDAEEVSTKAKIEPEESSWVFLYGNPKPTYTYMMLGKIIVYFSDNTSEELYI